MTIPTRQITVDAAMAEFQAVLRAALGDRPPGAAANRMTPEEREDVRFRLAEFMLSLACPDPRACSHPHCRRNVICRHFVRVQAKRASGKASHPMRTPGAEAARYAVWVYMSSAP